MGFKTEKRKQRFTRSANHAKQERVVALKKQLKSPSIHSQLNTSTYEPSIFITKLYEYNSQLIDRLYSMKVYDKILPEIKTLFPLIQIVAGSKIKNYIKNSILFKTEQMIKILKADENYSNTQPQGLNEHVFIVMLLAIFNQNNQSKTIALDDIITILNTETLLNTHLKISMLLHALENKLLIAFNTKQFKGNPQFLWNINCINTPIKSGHIYNISCMNLLQHVNHIYNNDITSFQRKIQKEYENRLDKILADIPTKGDLIFNGVKTKVIIPQKQRALKKEIEELKSAINDINKTKYNYNNNSNNNLVTMEELTTNQARSTQYKNVHDIKVKQLTSAMNESIYHFNDKHKMCMIEFSDKFAIGQIIISFPNPSNKENEIIYLLCDDIMGAGATSNVIQCTAIVQSYNNIIGNSNNTNSNINSNNNKPYELKSKIICKISKNANNKFSTELNMMKILKKHKIHGISEVAFVDCDINRNLIETPNEQILLLKGYNSSCQLSVIIEGKYTFMFENSICYLIYKLLLILIPLHKNGVIHRDIKPQNILMIKDDMKLSDSAPLTMKLIDWDTAVVIPDGYNYVAVTEGYAIGTNGYIAPEIILNSMSYAASDMYSLGITATEIIIGKKPTLNAYNNIQQFEKQKEALINQMKEMKPGNKAMKLVEQMLAHNYMNRPTAQQAADILYQIINGK